MIIGVPKEIKNNEFRVAITASGVHELRHHGHEVLIEAGAGLGSGITDAEALEAFHALARTEGILAALESSHAVALGMKLARDLGKDKTILVNLSGRGDKDVHTIAQHEGITL